MVIRYIALSASLLVLSGCGLDSDTASTLKQIATQNAATQSEQVQINQPTFSHETAVMAQAEASIKADEERLSNADIPVEKAKIVNEESQETDLPFGRLTGIIDTGTYKQAIINNQDKVIRLKEGENWQDWTVTEIHPEKIIINSEGEEHTLLLLSEFRAPQRTQTELDNRAEPVSHQQPENVQQDASAPPPFTEEQITELRSRLLMGR